VPQLNELNKDAYFGKVGYTPHSVGQRRFHASKARFRIAACGRRYGKSTMAGTDAEPRLFVPKNRIWIVGPTYDLGEKEFRVIWDHLIVGLEFGKDRRVKKAYNKRSGEMYIEFPNQTRLEVRSAQHPETLVGDNLDHVIMSEAAKHRENTFEQYIRAALADRRGTADFPSTPEGLNWFHDVYALGLDVDQPDYESFHFPSWENPVVYPGGRQDPEILTIERTTSPEYFAQEYGADFTTFVGRIYTEFDLEVHVQRHEFRPEWPNFMAIDWGFVEPLAALEFQVSPSDEVFVWREHYMSYRTVAEHCQLMKNREQPDGYHLDLAFGDAADPEAALVVSQHLVGCYTDPLAKANWREGVDLISSLMQPHDTGLVADEYGTPVTKPHLFFDPSCKNSIREHMNYKRGDNVNSRTPEASKHAPTDKQADHCCDALRYGAMHVFMLGARHHLSDVMQTNSGPVRVQANPSTEPRTRSTDEYEGLGVLTVAGERDAGTFFDMEMQDF